MKVNVAQSSVRCTAGGCKQSHLWRTVLWGPQVGHFFVNSLFWCLQVLTRDLQNLTHPGHCVLPFVPLKKLTDTVDGGTILGHIDFYRDTRWSPQQVHIKGNLFS